MTHKSITHRRLFTCMLVIALLVATFVASTFTTSANTTVLEGVELKLGHTIGFIYYSKQDYTENTVMRFEINGRITDVPAIPNDQTCAFIFNDIYPHELAHDIKTTIFVDGKPVASYPTFSMKEYLLNELLDTANSKDTDKLKLISNLLQYGEATREYRNANVDASERDNVEILDFDRSIYKTYDPDSLDTKLDGTANNLGISSNDIHLSSIGISYYNTNKYVVTLVVPDDVSVPMEEIVVYIDDTPYHMDDDSNDNIKNTQPGVYEIYSDPIHANEVSNYRPQITLSVFGNEVQRIDYGCEDYILHLQQLEPNTLAENYAQALYYYGQAANKVYTQPSVIALAPLKKPDDITLTNSQPHLPTGGAGAAYMSDGSIQEVKLTWSLVEAITDDTYEVEREVVGSYVDPVTKREYTAKTTVTLRNPLKEIQRWTDPGNITPDINATEYIIDDAEVKAIWSNGYSDIRDANPFTIKDKLSAQTLSAFKQIQLDYTDPKSKVTCTTENLFVYFDNPIIAITMTQNTPLQFSTKPLNQINVDAYAFTYTVEFESGYSWTGNYSDVHITLNDTHTNPTYSGSDTSGTVKINWTGTPRNSEYNAVSQQYINGQMLPDYTLSAYKPITWSCVAEFVNQEVGIYINTAPTCSINSTEAPSSKNGMLSGGITYLKLSNGAERKLDNSEVQYVAQEGITDASYYKVVTVYATYKSFVDDCEITINNPIITNSLTQNLNGQMHVHASIASQKFTTAELKHFTNGLTVTYANGVTANVTPTGFYVGTSNAVKTEFYAHNIQDTSRKSSLYTDGWLSQTLTSSSSNNSIRAIYSDNRPGVTGATTMTCNIGYYVINAPETCLTQALEVLASSNPNESIITRQEEVDVKLMNGKTATIMLEFEVSNVQDNRETIIQEINQAYTENFKTIIIRIDVIVNNPVIEILDVSSDPDAITITSINAITNADIKKAPGVLSVRFYNGLTGYVTPQQFSNLENAKITDTTMMKLCTIQASYQSPWENAEKLQCNMQLLLMNPPVGVSATLNYGSSTNKLVLSTKAQNVTFTECKIKYSNQQLSPNNLTPNVVPQIFKSGTNVDGTAITAETGDQLFPISISYGASETYYIRDSGDPLDHTISAGTVSTNVTVFWKNTVKSITVTDIKCLAQPGSSAVTPTNVKVTVLYNNDAVATNKNASASAVANITTFDASASRTTTVTYTATHNQKTSISHSFIMYNPITNITYPQNTNDSSYFKPTKLTSSSSTTVSNVYAIYRANGRWSSVGPGHSTYPNSWLNMDLSSNNTAISFKNDKSIAPTVTYTGTSVEVILNCTATLNSNAITTPYDEVTTCTHTIKLINTPSFVNTYSSTTDSQSSNSLKVPAWTGTKDKIQVTLSVIGANGKTIATNVTATANNTLYNGNGSYQFVSQINGNGMSSYSINAETLLEFTGTYQGYTITPAIISCYVENTFDHYAYLSEKITRTNTATNYSPSDFNVTLYIAKVYTNGHTADAYNKSYIFQTPSALYVIRKSSSAVSIDVSTLSVDDAKCYTSTISYSAFYGTGNLFFALRLPDSINHNADGNGGPESVYPYDTQFFKNSKTYPVSDFYQDW